MKKMIKRKDGSYSQRGLWDNIRANKGSGKEPTKDMLKQESKIKKEENMKSMYKKGGKPSKKKIMKEAKKEGESFMVENKELSFGAPQMKMGGRKKYEDGGTSTTRKNLFGRTIVENVNTSSAPSFSEDNRVSTTNRTKQVYRKDGSLLKEKNETEVNRPMDYDVFSSKSKYDKEGNLIKTRMGESKGMSYKKGGMMKYEAGGKKKEPLPKNALEAYKQAKARNDAKTETSNTETSNLVNSLRKKEIEKGIITYDDYLKQQTLKKKKKGGFDLNNDGKTTFKDVLIGRGVIDKKKKGGAKSMEPGGGGRFAKMVSGLKKEGKSEDSAKAIAASIGRKKYGKSKFQAMAAAGKKKMGGKKC